MSILHNNFLWSTISVLEIYLFFSFFPLLFAKWNSRIRAEMVWTNRIGSENNKNRKTKCSHFRESQSVKEVSKGQHLLVSAIEGSEKKIKRFFCNAWNIHSPFFCILRGKGVSFCYIFVQIAISFSEILGWSTLTQPKSVWNPVESVTHVVSLQNLIQRHSSTAQKSIKMDCICLLNISVECLLCQPLFMPLVIQQWTH